MTRPSSANGPHDPLQNDPISDFATRLRELRSQAGSPSFRQLAKTTHYSRSALQEATSGKRLPSEALLKAFVIGCGADPEEWLKLLRNAARPSGKAAASELPPGRRRFSLSRRTLARAAIAVPAALLVLMAGAMAGATIQRHHDKPARRGDQANEAGATGKAADGADPIAAGCVNDARLIDKSPVMMGGRQIGALELIYSARCKAGWARIYLYPGEPEMLGKVTVKASDGRLAAFANPLVRQISVYTNVIGQPAGQCLGAIGIFYPVGRAPVTATITCQAVG